MAALRVTDILGEDAAPRYYDPQLWMRLEPHVLEMFEREVTALVQRRAPTFEHYHYQLGVLEGIRRVMVAAAELNRVRDDEHRGTDRSVA